MTQRPQALFEPRKSPVQARSTASVEAILEATVQVLLWVGKERLTTTRVAERAGVSVGTLYQYFPNKVALLQAALRRHLEEVAVSVERVCLAQAATPLAAMATALVNAFLEAKMRHAATSVALYSISADVDGAKIAKEMGARCTHAIAAMLSTASQPLNAEPQMVAAMLQGTMAGVSRRLLESDAPEEHVEATGQELIFLVGAYLEACSSRQLVARRARRTEVLTNSP